MIRVILIAKGQLIAHTWMSKIKTVDSAQPRNRSVVIKPFSSGESGIWAQD